MPSSISRRAIIMVIAAIVLVIATLVLVNRCEKKRSEGAQARVEAGQAGAQSNSSADAINTVSAAGEREAGSEELTRNNERDIRKADGASDKVKPGVDAAGRSALCKREAYKNLVECKGTR